MKSTSLTSHGKIVLLDPEDEDLRERLTTPTTSGYARVRTGQKQPELLRHINGNRMDCRRGNIDPIQGQSENLLDENWNKEHTHARGVHQRADGVYFVAVCKNYKQMRVGGYDSLADANTVAISARQAIRDGATTKEEVISGLSPEAFAIYQNRR
jgi:hypothetical protein